ncbi:MAG: hypothetical protein ACKO4T_06310 [Planctomycetaceae bacterium]
MTPLHLIVMLMATFLGGRCAAGDTWLTRLRQQPIRGVCGDLRLADAVARGANTVRTYAAPTTADLDRLHALGLRVIVGHWMPHEGRNMGREGWPWEHSYVRSAETMDRDFAAIVERIGGHPAIVMWSLGNEVRLEPRYLAQADRLSRIVHARHPDMPTSLTMVNAPQESVALVRKHAPDIDVIGANVYGAGAVTTALTSLHEHWPKPFYFSEFGPTGPWWGPQTSWGVRFEQAATSKAADFAKAWERIAAADDCLGGCAFSWGQWQRERITYFSMLLTADPWARKAADDEHRFTPLADEMARLWAGAYPRDRAPRLDRIEIDGRTQCDIILPPGKPFVAAATVTDSPRSPRRYRWWIARQDAGSLHSLVGPIDATEPTVTLQAPAESGLELMLLCLVLDGESTACGSTMPFKTAD